MAAVPVSLMHHSGLQIPTQMMSQMLPACSLNSSMLSMNVPSVAITGSLSHPTMTMAAASTAAMNSAMNYPQFQMASQPQQQPQQVAPLQIQPPSNEHFLNGEAAMSPSRSLSSASPPTSMMNGGGIPPQSATPTPEEEKNPEYLKELQAEKDGLESAYAAAMASATSGQQSSEAENSSDPDSAASKTNHAIKLLEQEIARVQSGRNGGSGVQYREPIKYVDVYRERPIRLTVRVLVPVREHPKFNFVGKLLGPKGNSMKRLQEETMTKMAVLGRGSMRDKQKEEELRASNDPKYQHLQEELHTEITAFAPPAEAHARIAYALTEVRKYLIPDSNDDIRQEQMREMEILTANGDNVTAAALAATMGTAGMTGTVADPTKRAQMQSAVATAAAQQPAASLAGMYSQPNLAMMHPAFRPNLSLATHQSIQNQAAAAAAMLRASGHPGSTGHPVISAASAAALSAAAAMRSQNGQLMQAAGGPAPPPGASPYIAAAPMIRKMVQAAPACTVAGPTGTTIVGAPVQNCQQQKLYNEEMMLEAQAMSQAPSEVPRDEGSDADAWQGLKAPTVHHDQRSKFRQQTAPYIRPN